MFIAKWEFVSTISWREQVKFDIMMMMSACTRPTRWGGSL